MKLDELINDFGRTYTSEPNKRIDNLVAELTVAVENDFEEQLREYANEKGEGDLLEGDQDDVTDMISEWVQNSITIQLP